MEQATNLFTKGLLMDSHPMVQGNDTLTDCLNGTLITMNGNEVILLNDMGNRRVDKAFLPPGYEPVGMKEYGGIIYVAAYNPITNKSQIGSFPSPLKKLNNQSEESLVGRFDFSSFLGDYNIEEDSVLGLNVLKTDSFMIPLTKNLSLRAGDKFAIYSEGFSELENLITNYNNIYGDKAYSPKNRKYTLQLGVLNSQNEFVDITKTLCRWKDFGEEIEVQSEENDGETETVWQSNWLPVKYSSETSDIFKFNDGYFISDSYENTFNTQTIEDSKLIKERQKIAANTYSYKLVGPLYLKIGINHIENFNYNIYGTYDDGIATLWVEGFVTYNCPDKATKSLDNLNFNENYVTFDEGIPDSSFGFDLINYTPTDINIEESVYNPNNNTYTTKIVKKYVNIVGTDGTIFNYVLGVKADVDTEGIYLKGLSTKGSLDLSLLGSGALKFYGWRFYNNIEELSTILTFTFNAYPEYGKSFGNLKLNFKEIGSSKIIQYPKTGFLPVYNGKQTINFDWKDYNFLPNKTYTVTATYYSIDNNTNILSEQKTISETQIRWFLTTELFNDFYLSSAGISDYCNVPKDNSSESDAFYNKMLINFTNTSDIENRSSSEEKFEGSLIKNQVSKIEYLCEHNYNIFIKSNPTLEIKDKEKYPDYVYLKDNYKKSIKIDNIQISQIGNINNPSPDSEVNTGNPEYYNNTIRPQLITRSGNNLTLSGEYNSPIDALTSQNLLETKLSISNNTVTGYIKHYDIYESKGEKVDIIYNGFDNFSEILNENDALPTTQEYGGIVVNYDRRSGHGDEHYINAVIGQTNNNVYLPPNSDTPEGWYGLSHLHGDSRKTMNISSMTDMLYLYFNLSSNNTFTFLYLFANDNYYTTSESANNGINGASKTRVWWQMTNGEWAVFPNLLEKKNGINGILTDSDVASFIRSGIGKDLVYCMHDTINNDSVYAPKQDYIYYDKYSIPLTYNISYKLILSEEETTSDIITTGNSYGNLSFKVTNSPSITNDTVEFILNSSETFFDNINTLDIDNISNIYVKNGSMQDSLGRPLNPRYIYSLENGKLVRLNTSNFYIDTVNKLNSKNRLLYNISKKRSINPRYQSAASGDAHTVLVYNLLNVVDPV